MIGQHESALLAKLPLEIRYRIYELVFGDKIIIFTAGSQPKFRHCLCTARGQKWHLIDWLNLPSPWSRCSAHGKHEPTPRLPLLLTCRQIFSESVPILWSQSPVHVQLHRGPVYPGLLSDLQSTIMPTNFQAIRSLEVSFLHPVLGTSIQTLDDRWFSWWTETWDVIKGMRGLVYLQAWIKMHQEPREDYVTAEQEAKLFAPLMELYWLRGFKVEVTWPPTEGSEDLLRGAPFDLDRNNDPIPGKPVVADYVSIRARQVPG
ncbi:hypothetical protein ASPVEDRAFT_46754 [Aspergillus versicolor CBS 583.65]|uniref:DUF7730 domain-containing protein n=1 Tax=Aspergillus versicolor CBS 583.65 TaxID=1036611 RepID=A0A1L9Q148_ASPVE|nr:uncharacterized protein ASPVEDRAFT_46754 [Aspergillus versicolor CBS 583.65]OJJ07446.1 hypothetical protein ASPVEDRAFT_46754 [Aspergillus versicolor CBS 583.65]